MRQAIKSPIDRGARTHLARLDRYLRRADTSLAEMLRHLSPATGPDYIHSAVKRGLDIALGVPALIAAALPIILLVVVNKLLHPNLPALFLQERVGGRGKSLAIVKIRSLLPATAGLGHPYDPAMTRFGRFIRRHKLDELPQIAQVLTGELSLVGIRVLPIEVYEDLRAAWSRPRFKRWSAVYATTRLGLTGVHQVLRGAAKADRLRFHRDVFYSSHASLGLDLYLLWRTALRILRPPKFPFPRRSEGTG